MDTATTSPSTQIPGCVFVAVNKEGTEIFSHASGKKGVDSSEAMTSETVFWIASCTKMIAGIACMQLVEQGKLKLDDAEQAETLAPELQRVKFLKGWGDDGKPVLEEKKNRITLRMLLSHTGMFLLSF
jgi:CubicO group peptidase (beta-lactamase class C family)